MRPVRIARIGTNAYSRGDGIFKTLKKLPEEFEIAGFALPEGEREKLPERMKMGFWQIGRFILGKPLTNERRRATIVSGD